MISEVEFLTDRLRQISSRPNARCDKTVRRKLITTMDRFSKLGGDISNKHYQKALDIVSTRI